MTGGRCERSVDGCGLYSALLDSSLVLDGCTYLDTEAVRSAARRRVLVHRYLSAICSSGIPDGLCTHRHVEYMYIWYSHLT
jgi:hypothetical protein